MKVLPITTNDKYNKPIVSKGFVSAPIETMIKNMATSCRENVQYHSLFNREVASNYMKYAETAENILYNLRTIMLHYSVGSVLKAKKSVKHPQKLRFYISENASDYKRILGDVYQDKNDITGNITRMAEFTDKFAKENPFETYLKFKLLAKEPNSQTANFLPEKESLIIEDELREYSIYSNS
ncbi:hypothetical protein IKQ21_00385 [bacterium]|nr:hypothetical protein [bacterium]